MECRKTSHKSKAVGAGEDRKDFGSFSLEIDCLAGLLTKKLPQSTVWNDDVVGGAVGASPLCAFVLRETVDRI